MLWSSSEMSANKSAIVILKKKKKKHFNYLENSGRNDKESSIVLLPNLEQK